jgi:Na+/melibiose symporter-like transporter
LESQLNTGKHRHNFWIGNAVLTVAMLTLFFMGPLSDALGIWAAVLWGVLAAVGMALVMSDKREEPPAPD